MGPYLGTPNTAKDSQNGDSSVCRWGATSMQGWRKSQEDTHIARTDLPDGVSIFGVFDGHGGREVSIFVEEKFCAELVKLEEYKSKNYGDALKRCFILMDEILLTDAGKARIQEIHASSDNQDVFSGGMMDQGSDNAARFVGCTATVVLISPTHIYCANAGDSRSVLARSVGQQCVPLSEDHKPDNKEESTRIHTAGGFVEENRVNGSLALSRSIGDFEYKMAPGLPYD